MKTFTFKKVLRYFTGCGTIFTKRGTRKVNLDSNAKRAVGWCKTVVDKN
jgi:hypothetical protein